MFRIRGIPACANKELLTDILRNEWGFRGYVVSDEAAIENMMTKHNYTHTKAETAAVAVNAGGQLPSLQLVCCTNMETLLSESSDSERETKVMVFGLCIYESY